MNPGLPAEIVERAYEEDESAARAEWGAEFRCDLEDLFDFDALARCVVPDRLELPPVSDLNYSAFTDPSGGRRDAFTVGIGHRDGERCVVDVIRGWSAPFSPTSVVSEIADLLRSYRISSVVGDRYAGEWPREAFRSHGISYDVADQNRSELYLSCVAFVNGARLEIPDDPVMLRELRGLERRRGPSGKDRVDHVAGAHDDRANSLAGVAHLLLGRSRGVSASDLYGARAAEIEAEEEAVAARMVQ